MTATRNGIRSGRPVEHQGRAWLHCGCVVLALAGGCGDSGPTDPEVEDPVSIIETVWSDYDRWYAFFPLLSLDWSAIGAAYRDTASRTAPGGATARLVGRMIGTLKDFHAALLTPFGVYGGGEFIYEAHFNPSLLVRYYARPLRRTPSELIAYTLLNDGTGYVQIGTFAGEGWGAEIDLVLEELLPLTGLIFDIRGNGGGNENVGRDIASRFYDAERVYRLARFRIGPGHTDLGAPVPFSLSPAGAKRFLGPVAVLTDRLNGSAAEDFVLMMRALPHAVTVGDTTLGVGSNPLPRELANGWTYLIPRSQAATPDGFVYNWKGLPPVIAVPWSADEVAAGRDPYVEAALAELKRRALR